LELQFLLSQLHFIERTVGILIKHYIIVLNIMGPSSYMRSVVDRNVVMRSMTVLCFTVSCVQIMCLCA